MTHSFFHDLIGFTSFSQACEARHYHPIPTDWFVILTDVSGSTKAIQEGRYKDVNMVGAACITAVVNSCKGIDVPYVFGGDGATLLVPPDCVDKAVSELLAVKRIAQHMHQLNLRVGVVPMQEIAKRGKRFEVAKYIMPTGCALAMYRGGGANLADDLVKHHGFEVPDNEDDTPPDLTGLSCRWQPIKAKHDTIMTLLVLALDSDEEETVYEELTHFITELLEDDARPVHAGGLRYTWPGWRVLKQARMVWQQGKVLRNLLGHIGMITLFHILHIFNMRLGNFDVSTYRDDMIVNSDYRKFDDMVRMVLDCTNQQVKTIEAYLATLHKAGKIAYGTHYSNTALMTCFVLSTDSAGHVHFIDGNDGGYALAAKQLKTQLSELAGKAA